MIRPELRQFIEKEVQNSGHPGLGCRVLERDLKIIVRLIQRDAEKEYTVDRRLRWPDQRERLSEQLREFVDHFVNEAPE